jgi:hypothetical protein
VRTDALKVGGGGTAILEAMTINPMLTRLATLCGKLDDLERFTPLLRVPQVVLQLLAQPTLGAGVEGNG